jgi:hypothetical protein
MSSKLERQMSRREQDLEAVSSTVLTIRDTVGRHTDQLCNIRGEINYLSEKVTDVRGEGAEVKVNQAQQSRTLDEHTKALAEILRRLPAED